MNKFQPQVNFNIFLTSILLVSFILFYGKFLLLPLSLAIFIFVIIKSLSGKLVNFFNQKFYVHINTSFSLILVLMFFLSFIYFFWMILEQNLANVVNNSDYYQNNLIKITNFFSDFGINKLVDVNNLFESVSFINIFSKVMNHLTEFTGNFSLIIIYIIFFIIEEKFLIQKINFLFKKNSTVKILKKINMDVFRYFQIKTLTSVLIGFVTFTVLYIINIDLAPTFGMLAFFLNFIPFIGSLLSVILPSLFSFIQFLDLFNTISIFLILSIFQILIGNFLETKLMGKTLNISPIVMIIFLSIMGHIWGIAGMFLSVPMLVFMLIIFSNFKSTKDLSIIISEKVD